MGTPLEDPETKSIGVAAGDFDGDGQEEVDLNHFCLATLIKRIRSKLLIYLLALCCNHAQQVMCSLENSNI